MTHLTRVSHTEEELDALRELGNVAFSHAATALSTFVDKSVEISIPSVRVLHADRATGISGTTGAEFMVLLRVLGDRAGSLALVFPEKDAAVLADMLAGLPEGPARGLTPGAEAILSEVANIMCGSALLAMYRFLGVSLVHSSPVIHFRTRDEAWDLSVFDVTRCILIEAQFAVHGQVARGVMVISFEDLQFFLDALAEYAGGA